MSAFILVSTGKPKNAYKGDSMSKVRDKRSMSKSIICFVEEMGKIIRQMDDFGPFLNNFCNFRVFLDKNQKYPKITVLKK